MEEKRKLIEAEGGALSCAEAAKALGFRAWLSLLAPVSFASAWTAAITAGVRAVVAINS